MTVEVATVPTLARVVNVELMHTGTWDLSTGTTTFTTDDLSAAVAALNCPGVRRPHLKLGHTDPRFDGEPAVGWIDNLATADAGRTLVGDYVGIPAWLGDVIASAYPSRSIEGEWNHNCQGGHTHPFVVTAVALLGVTPPGIGTLASLQDVAALYGVAASPGTGSEGSTPVTVTVHATTAPVPATAPSSSGAAMPNPRPFTVAAAVSVEDVRRAYYATPEGSGWSMWIEELQLDPMQLIVMNDSTMQRSRVPIVVDSTGDGMDAVSFGEPTPVLITYVDVAAASAATSRPTTTVRYASRAESRPDAPAATSPTTSPTVPPTTAPVPTLRASATPDPLTPGADVAFTAEHLTTMRTAMGLPNTADEAAIVAALAASQPETPAPSGDNDTPPGTTTTPPTTTDDDDEDVDVDVDVDPAAPVGLVQLDEATYAQLVAAAAAGTSMVAESAAAARERLVDAAVADGRIPPARRDPWLRALIADPGAQTTLASLQPGLVPLIEIGHANPSGGDGAAASAYDALYGPTRKA